MSGRGNERRSSFERPESSGSEMAMSSANLQDVKLSSSPSPAKISGKAWGRVRKFFTCSAGFPTSVYYIVGNEFCERFSYYGMKAILILYLSRVLLLSDDTATAVFHSFSMLCYFTPLFGAMMADGWLGKYRTILYVSLVYALGNIIVSLTSFPPFGAGEIPGPMIGLFLIALGTGGIKPCVSAFGGDQIGAGQTKLIQRFFSVFYFAINAGSLLSMLITPVLRGDVKCFGSDCYPLAFGVPALLMLMAVALFWGGRHGYKRNPPTGNVVGQVARAVMYALKRKFTTKGEQKTHWMDWAEDRYSADLISDIKSLFRVLLTFLPLPVFWALFDQQGSRWVLQAERMDGDAGFLGTIKPDQMQALNALFIIILVPVFEGIIYPIFKKPRPLKRMCLGMILAASAFIIAGLVEVRIQNSEGAMDIPGQGQSYVQLLNAVDCPIATKVGEKQFKVKGHSKSGDIHLEAPTNITLRITSASSCSSIWNQTFTFGVGEKQRYDFVLGSHGSSLVGRLVEQNVTLPPPGKSKLCLVTLMRYQSEKLSAFLGDKEIAANLSSSGMRQCGITTAGHYRLKIGSTTTAMATKNVVLHNGGVYTVVIQDSRKINESLDVSLYEDLGAKSVSMFWQVPQYFVITSGEILFSITGLEFAYSQAPTSMKSCLQAAWLLTVAFGNLIVVIEAESHLFTNQASEFFFFAGMLVVVSLIFMVISYFYKYVDEPTAGPAIAMPTDLNYDQVGILNLDELADHSD